MMTVCPECREPYPVAPHRPDCKRGAEALGASIASRERQKAVSAVGARLAPFMNPDATYRLCDAIDAASKRRPGVPIPSLRDVDLAIQSSAEAWLERNGPGPMPAFEYGTPRFGEIMPDILARLDLPPDLFEPEQVAEPAQSTADAAPSWVIVENLSAKRLQPGDRIVAVSEHETVYSSVPIFTVQRPTSPEVAAALQTIFEKGI